MIGKWTLALATQGGEDRAFQGRQSCKALREERVWGVESRKEQLPENSEPEEALGGVAREPR